jgi:uncharacterized membrane protein YdjX (TVP38/TMEM64 family)
MGTTLCPSMASDSGQWCFGNMAGLSFGSARDLLLSFGPCCERLGDHPETEETMTCRTRWLAGTMAATFLAAIAAAGLWIRLSDSTVAHNVLRLYKDPAALRAALHHWGALAPLVFIGIQALQVLVAPIPGEVTGFLGGFVFGQWRGLGYSMIGLMAGSLLAFVIGRWLGVAFVQRRVSPAVWARLGFVVETQGAIVCFLLYLIPGLPKDILCYLFGLSSMPFWVFATASTLGRLPSTWILSAQGANTATGHYVQTALIMAVVAAVSIPLYASRHRILARFGHRSARPTAGSEAAVGTDR